MRAPLTIETAKRPSPWIAIVVVGATLANGACASMLGYEPLENVEPASMPERDSSAPAPDDASTVEAEATPASTYPGSVMQDQPLAYYRFNALETEREHQGRGGLRIVGTPTVVPGAIAGDTSTQLSLVSTNGSAYLDLTAVQLEWTKQHTIEAWLSVTVPREAPATWLVLGRNDMTANGFVGIEGAVVGPGGVAGDPTQARLVMIGRSVAGPGATLEAPFAVTPPSSVHVVHVYDGVEMSIWVGGTLRGRTLVTKRDPEPGRLFVIGAALHPAPAGFPALVPRWNGTIDELAIYDKALAPARIQEHYAIGTGKK